MKYYFLYLILRLLAFNPLGALFMVLIIYIAIDRRFIGILPDFLAFFRGWRKISSLKSQIKATPLQADGLYELGALLVERGKANQALEYLQRAESLIPDHPEIQYYLGRAYLESGLLNEARSALEKALRLNPKIKYGAPYVYLIDCIVRKENYDPEMEGYLEKIEEYGSPEFYYKTGLIFKKHGYREKAKAMFGKAVTNLSNYPSFYRKKHRYWAFRARLRRLIT